MTPDELRDYNKLTELVNTLKKSYGIPDEAFDSLGEKKWFKPLSEQYKELGEEIKSLSGCEIIRIILDFDEYDNDYLSVYSIASKKEEEIVRSKIQKVVNAIQQNYHLKLFVIMLNEGHSMLEYYADIFQEYSEIKEKNKPVHTLKELQNKLAEEIKQTTGLEFVVVKHRART